TPGLYATTAHTAVCRGHTERAGDTSHAAFCPDPLCAVCRDLHQSELSAPHSPLCRVHDARLWRGGLAHRLDRDRWGARGNTLGEPGESAGGVFSPCASARAGPARLCMWLRTPGVQSHRAAVWVAPCAGRAL